MNKKIIIFLLFAIFTALTFAVKFCLPLTNIDITIETFIQNHLSFIPLKYPVFADKTGYSIMIFSGLIISCIYFAKKREWLQITLVLSLPITAYLLNGIIKDIIQRQRPPLDLQISWIHPTSFSYISRHTFITFCLFGIIIYYLNTRCKNNFIKYTGITISILWILFTGLSRIWIGVHYPSDVLGACILGSLVLILYIELAKLIKGKYNG